MKHIEDPFGDLTVLEIRGFRATAMFHRQAFRDEVWPEDPQSGVEVNKLRLKLGDAFLQVFDL